MSQQQTQLKVLLLGDSCYDEYHFGTVDRLSPEAPIPILGNVKSVTKQGMAANVRENLVNLGVDVTFITHYMETKHRYIDTRSNQQLLRVDQKIGNLINVMDLDQYNDIEFGQYDAVVISDYDKGFISYEVVEQIRKLYSGPIFVDSKKPDLKRFNGCYVKVNEFEWLNRTSSANDMIITFGGKRVEYKFKHFIPPKVDAHDVCGAGDTFLAALAVEYLRTQSMEKAIDFAMHAAAITVKHIGVYAPSLEEIYNDKA